MAQDDLSDSERMALDEIRQDKARQRGFTVLSSHEGPVTERERQAMQGVSLGEQRENELSAQRADRVRALEAEVAYLKPRVLTDEQRDYLTRHIMDEKFAARAWGIIGKHWKWVTAVSAFLAYGLTWVADNWALLRASRGQ